MPDNYASSSTERSDEEAGSKDGIAVWPITKEVEKMRQRNEANGGKPRKLGLTWKNLTVKGISSDATFNENVLSQFYPFGKTG